MCNAEGEFDGRGWLELPDGRRFYTSAGEWNAFVRSADTPFSAAIERLPLEGAPVVEQDFSESLRPSDPLSAAPGGSGGGGGGGSGGGSGGELAADAGGCTSVGSAAIGLWVLLGAIIYAWSRRPALRSSIERIRR